MCAVASPHSRHFHIDGSCVSEVASLHLLPVGPPAGQLGLENGDYLPYVWVLCKRTSLFVMQALVC